MTRKHKLIKRSPYRKINSEEQTKKRYPTRKSAEDIAEVQMLQNPGLELFVYEGPDGGWYLTRRKHNN